MKFLQDASINLVSGFLGIVLGILGSVVIARALGPEGRGVYALLLLFGTTIALTANLGLGQSAVYYYGRKKSESAKISGSLFSMAWLIGVPVAILLLAFMPAYGDVLLKDVPFYLVALIICLTPIALSRNYVAHLFVSVQDFRWYNAINLLDLLGRILLFLPLLALGLGLTGAILAFTVSLIVLTVVAWTVICQRLNIDFRWNGNFVKELTTYGVRVHLAVVLAFLTIRIDQFLIGYFLDVSQVGIYAVAFSIAEVVQSISTAVALLVFARVSSNDSESAFLITNRTLRFTGLLSVIGALGVMIATPLLIPRLFGEEFVSATSVVWLLLPGVIMQNLSQVIYSSLSGRGKPELGIYVRLATLALLILLDSVMLPRFGINGAALTWSGMYFISTGAYLVMYLRDSCQSARVVFAFSNEDRIIVQAVLRRIIPRIRSYTQT